jgi:hypothetical protein
MPVVAGHRKKRCLLIAFTIMLLSSAATATLLVNLAKANPYMYHVEVSPPVDVEQTAMSIDPVITDAVYSSNSISVNLNVSIPKTQAIDKYHLAIGGIWYQKDLNKSYIPVYLWSGSGSQLTDFSGDVTVADLSEGYHNVTFLSSVDGGYADGLTWYWFQMKSYLTISFTVDTASPDVSVLSLENMTCEGSVVPLSFTVSEMVTELSYSLDGQGNVTVAGNTTLGGLPVGVHNVTVYAWDEAGNVGASETITFTITEPESEPKPFPTVPVAAASAAVVASVSAGILVYFKKRKH